MQVVFYCFFNRNITHEWVDMKHLSIYGLKSNEIMNLFLAVCLFLIFNVNKKKNLSCENLVIYHWAPSCRTVCLWCVVLKTLSRLGRNNSYQIRTLAEAH